MSIIDGTSFGLDEESWVITELEAIINSYALDGIDVDIEVQNHTFDVYVDGNDLGQFIEDIDEITPAIEDYLEDKR